VYLGGLGFEPWTWVWTHFWTRFGLGVELNWEPLDGWYGDEDVVRVVVGLERVLVDVGRVEVLGVDRTGVLW